MELEPSLSHERLFGALVFCLLFYSAKCDDLPKNVVVIAGSDKVLNCAEGDPFRWYRYLPSDPSNDKVLFMGSHMADNIDKRFRVLREPANYPYQRLDLLITDIQANHSGTYKCRTPQSSHCAELIVLASEPKCKAQRVIRDTNGTEEQMELQCNVNVTENGVPEMLFRHNSNGSTTRPTNCTARYNGMVSCVTVVQAQMLAEYTFSIKIKQKPILKNPQCNHASNEPDYQYICEVVPESLTCASTLMESRNWPFLNLLVLVGFSTLGALVIVLFVTLIFLSCRRRKKADPRYQKTMSSPGPNETLNSKYASLNSSPYEEIPASAEGLYCIADPDALATPYDEVTRTI